MAIIDRDIIFRLNNGDADAFKLIYTTYYVYLCAVSTKYVYDYEVAKEIVNDVFLTIWNKRKTLEYPIKTYLVRSVQNRSLNYLRDKQPDGIPLSELDEYVLSLNEEQIALGLQPLSHLENAEFEVLVADAIKTLPEKCRLIFTEYLYNHKTYEEIAILYDITSSTVRGQVRIALSKLKETLKEFYPLFFILYNVSK
ncbi:RNA polymerase sigma-70 factor [Massilibacteroides sp.]|uniref:RNA polymerase sigma-70 factor n=1 Tax=Massilibacteroides sp. TaxID=2034766 RepID=UPI0026366F72|nr:RNA polymerase sigma-70 factor [Massilibacteroides sp.]MDD4515242.1 RNA polymerase sigma-70 factor [Massilibacteroides sp.]